MQDVTYYFFNTMAWLQHGKHIVVVVIYCAILFSNDYNYSAIDIFKSGNNDGLRSVVVLFCDIFAWFQFIRK